MAEWRDPRYWLIVTAAIAAELLTIGCAARHVPVPGCPAVQAVIPPKCGVDSYLREVHGRVEVVCVVNGQEHVQLVTCLNKLPEPAQPARLEGEGK